MQQEGKGVLYTLHFFVFLHTFRYHLEDGYGWYVNVNINVNVPPIRKGEGETEGVNQDEPIVFSRMAMKKD